MDLNQKVIVSSATVRSFIKTFNTVYIHKMLVIYPIIGFCSYFTLSRGNHLAYTQPLEEPKI